GGCNVLHIGAMAVVLSRRTPHLFISRWCGGRFKNRWHVEFRHRARFFALVQIAVTLRQTLSAAGTVWAFEAKPEKKRLIALLLLEKLDRIVSRHIRGHAVRFDI